MDQETSINTYYLQGIKRGKYINHFYGNVLKKKEKLEENFYSHWYVVASYHLENELLCRSIGILQNGIYKQVEKKGGFSKKNVKIEKMKKHGERETEKSRKRDREGVKFKLLLLQYFHFYIIISSSWLLFYRLALSFSSFLEKSIRIVLF